MEILVAQPVLGEVPDKVLAAIVGDQALCALRFQETYVVKNVFKRFIGLAQRAQRGVEDAAIGDGGIVEFVLEILPPGAFGDKEAVVIVRIFSVLSLGFRDDHALQYLFADEFFVLGVEHIGTAFQEKHPEDVVLVGGGIEPLLAKAIGSGIEMAFKLGE